MKNFVNTDGFYNSEQVFFLKVNIILCSSIILFTATSQANWKKTKMLIALTLVWKKTGICSRCFLKIKVCFIQFNVM